MSSKRLDPRILASWRPSGAAHRGDLDVLISSGGNFLEVLPDPAYCREALSRRAP
ncbi:hypothetical protein [Nonomuraea polychroma]|uniref:hypothetical protein n=1 Tax=Nonomuraea polychroma TaxID=46176 RepID=UPI0013E36CA6|nr:hypothetical protein [Nonomuraea polychroma]